MDWTLNNENWDNEFESEEQIEEYMDALIELVRKEIEAQEDKVAILVPVKLQQMQFAHAVLKFLLKGSDAEITYALNAPFKSMGSIFVKAKKLEFTNAEWFSRAAEFANNMDIYPLTDGNIKLTLTFHGIVRPIE